ncbi:conserved hypothetical protein [Ricinus communis]|uniref:Uncharacterized protein n=1 Tax=Ricinus communis TaxID=3988 RepID=B9SPP0_RICCO|nr:conserved hypothetical protein [Ricinus communis]
MEYCNEVSIDESVEVGLERVKKHADPNLDHNKGVDQTKWFNKVDLDSKIFNKVSAGCQQDFRKWTVLGDEIEIEENCDNAIP